LRRQGFDACILLFFLSLVAVVGRPDSAGIVFVHAASVEEIRNDVNDL